MIYIVLAVACIAFVTIGMTLENNIRGPGELWDDLLSEANKHLEGMKYIELLFCSTLILCMAVFYFPPMILLWTGGWVLAQVCNLFKGERTPRNPEGPGRSEE